MRIARPLSFFTLLALGATSSFVACGGATADVGGSAATQDAGAAATSDASVSTLGDGGRASTPTTPTTPTTTSPPSPGTPTPLDAGAQGLCPNGEPGAGSVCGPAFGPVCTYKDVDCVCETGLPGNPPRWACAPRLPDGGVGCPLKEPSPGQSCMGYMGSQCDLGLGVCVCPADVVGPAWSCSDG